MRSASKLLVLLTLVLFLTSACAAAAPEGDPEPTSEAATPEPTEQTIPESTEGTMPEPTSDRETRIEDKDTEEEDLPERAPATEESQPVVGEVPDELMTKVLEDLSQRMGLAREEIEVLRAETALWNDGSLGCPRPGETYTQSPVQGYWIELSDGDTKYDYRASNTSYFFLCDTPLPPGSGAPVG